VTLYSTIPTAKAALKALLEARAGLSGVTIGWDRSAETQQATDRIYLFDTIDHSRDWVVLGPRRIDEEYTLQVVVSTFGSGTEPTATETRLWELVSEVELAVIDNIEIGDTVRQSKPDGTTSTLVPTDEGWIASATVRIVCQARI
jgi:outer membrane receptor for monomeric catechols